MIEKQYTQGPRRSFGGSKFGPRRNGFRSRKPAIKKVSGSSIDINKLVKKAKHVEELAYEPKHTFGDFNIDAKLKYNLKVKGYELPTAIQDQAIPVALTGVDVVGLANTGTGKTAAFLIPLINKVVKNRRERVLVLAPTRELAVQIREELFAFTEEMRIFSLTCIGGVGMRYQIETLKKNPHFIVGTPGRVKDLIDKGYLDISSFNSVVLDEADRMLDMGFVDDMRYLLSLMPAEKQVMLFSATMSPEIKHIIHDFQKSPTEISVRTAETSDNVNQDVIKVLDHTHKMDTLHDMLIAPDYEKVIIFGRTKGGVERLENELTSRGFSVSSIHGDKSQRERQYSLRQFKDHKIQALIATDVAARGLDIPNVSHVINFDVPATYEDYTHRIGRTGRAGKVGHAVTFIHEE